jgi:hypothetical protein
MNPELAAILGRDLNPAPGSEPVPSHVMERLRGQSKAVQKHRARFATSFSFAAPGKVRPHKPKPKRQAKPKPALKSRHPVHDMPAEDLMALRAEHGTWGAVAKHLGCSTTTLTERTHKLGVKVEAAPPLTPEILMPALVEHGNWRAVAHALRRREQTVMDAVHAFGLAVQHRRSDDELLAAYDQAGSVRGTAERLGMACNGSFHKRLRRLLEARR